MSNVKYELTTMPTHMNAPDAWIVWSTTISHDEDGEPYSDTDVVCSGLGLQESLNQIKLMEEVNA